MNARSAKAKKSDVLIVGAGPLGWSCAQLLSSKGISTLLADPNITDITPSWTAQGLGIFWPSLNDPPTRAVVAHGLDMARWLQNFCRLGSESVGDFFHSDAFKKIRCVRVGLASHEVRELNQACTFNLGLRAAENSSGAHLFEESPAFLIAEKDRRDAFAKRRLSDLGFCNERVISISEDKDGCTVLLGNNQVRECEMVILANGYQIAKLVPWVKDMLVPMSDVYSEWSSNLACEQHSEPLAVRTASGHVAALFLPQAAPQGSGYNWTVRLTGPRFLLPSAGAGIDLSGQTVSDSLSEKIDEWLRTSLLPVVTDVLQSGRPANGIKLQAIGARFGVDCLPCDELPILGELGNQGRILASTGWLGCGWSASLQSASVLCELIEKGSSPRLAGLLKPSRWRSGMSDDGVTGMT